jgi:gamma-glutamyltranspeptidase / glutathione hydrolase
MLRLGGNAVDAAIAAAFVQGVVNPMACGIGGTAEMNMYIAESCEHVLLRGLSGAGSRARPDVYQVVGESPRPNRWHVAGHENYLGYRAPTVPTFVRVVGEAHRLFGALPWERLLEPAIALASEGFEVWPKLASSWDPHAKGALDWPSGMETLSATEASASVYLKDGRFYGVGERLVQREYGATLERLAHEGPDAFYRGAIGDAMAADFERNDGLITRDDLRACRAAVTRPLHTTYRDADLWGYGPIRMLIFNILEGLDVSRYSHNSPEYLDCLARAMQLAHLERARIMGDPSFVDVPTQRVISKEYAKALRGRIERGDDLASNAPGQVPTFSTTGAVAIDGSQNAVAMMHSNGNSSGAMTPGLGYLYNNHMHNFNPLPGRRNSIEPGKQPHGAAGGPLILTQRGRPSLAIAHHSRAGTTSEVQIVLNMLEFGMTMQQAIGAERIHAEYEQRTVFVDPGFPGDLAEALERLGNQRVVFTSIVPAVAAVHCDPNSGTIVPGVDPRGGGGHDIVP